MELYSAIGLSEKEVKKISPEIASAVERLNNLGFYAQSEDAPTNIKEAYNSLYSDIERKITSTEFEEAARKKGIKLSAAIAPDKEVIVEDIPQKIKTLKDIVAEKKKRQEAPEPEEIKEEPTTEAPEPEEIKEEPTTEAPEPEEIKEEPTTEAPPISPDVSEMVGIVFKGDDKSAHTAKGHFTMMLSYGGTDYVLGTYKDDSGYHYHLSLDKSGADMVISLPLSSHNATHTAIRDCFEAYLEDKSTSIFIVGKNKEMITDLSNSVKGSSSFKEEEWLGASRLKDAKFDSGLYETVNDMYSDSMDGTKYYDTAKVIKQSWEAKKGIGKELSGTTQLYGLNYDDYIYRSAERYYDAGGSKIVVKKHTFYSPKGLTKSEVFAETETHLDPLVLKGKKFDKNISLGKRFQVQTNKLDDAELCRIIGSSTENNKNELYLVAESGVSVKIHRPSYNYFRKYYSGIEVRLSGETIVIFSKGEVVGLISSEKATQIWVNGMFEPSALKTELRNIDMGAYDFMVSQEGVIDMSDEEIEDEEIEDEEIEDEEIEDEEVEDEEVEESKWTEQQKLKDELVDRIEFLEELYDEAIDDDDDQLIDELESELETLGEILQETIEELLEVDADEEAIKLLKSKLKWVNELLKKL